MLTKLIIHPSSDVQRKQAEDCLAKLDLAPNHPDVLWLDEEKLGIKEAAKIKEHLLYKPIQAKGRVGIIIEANKLTHDAQNSLLKVLEEPPKEALLVLTASSENSLLPTILSRCQIIRVDNLSTVDLGRFEALIKGLFDAPLEEKFELIDREEDREGLLGALISYIHLSLADKPELLPLAKIIMEAEKYRGAQGNIRGILEYIALNI